MKKLMIITLVFMIIGLVSCSQQEYYEEMIPLAPPIEHQISGKSVWITHEKQLNENEILYYAPKSFKIDGNVYLNEETNYYIYTIDPDIFQWNQYRVATNEDLKEIFN